MRPADQESVKVRYLVGRVLKRVLQTQSRYDVMIISRDADDIPFCPM